MVMLREGKQHSKVKPGLSDLDFTVLLEGNRESDMDRINMINGFWKRYLILKKFIHILWHFYSAKVFLTIILIYVLLNQKILLKKHKEYLKTI